MPTTIDMRYGCNPHQAGARCSMADGRDLPIEPLNDAPSYINLMDALNAWQLVRDLKHAPSACRLLPRSNTSLRPVLPSPHRSTKP